MAISSSALFKAHIEALLAQAAKDIIDEYDKRVHHLENTVSRLKTELTNYQSVDPAFEDIGCGQPPLEGSVFHTSSETMRLSASPMAQSRRMSAECTMHSTQSLRASEHAAGTMHATQSLKVNEHTANKIPSRQSSRNNTATGELDNSTIACSAIDVQNPKQGLETTDCANAHSAPPVKPGASPAASVKGDEPAGLLQLIPCNVADDSGERALSDLRSSPRTPQDAPGMSKKRTLVSLLGKFEMRAHWELDNRAYSSISFRALSCTPRRRSLEFNDMGDLVEVKHTLNVCPIHPQSRLRLAWDMAAMGLLFYDMITIPMLVFNLPENGFRDSINMLTLLYWTVDIVFSFCTATFVDGVLVTKMRAIAIVYAKSWLFFDILVLLPDYTLLLGAGADPDGTKSVSLARAARTARYTKYIRLVRLLRVFKSNKMFRDLETRVNNNFAILVISVFRLALNMILMIHLLACAWYALGDSSEDGWVHREGLSGMPFGDRYLYSFQWSMARVHPSTFGIFLKLETVQERIFGIIVSLVAICGGGVLVSCITNKMAQLQAFRQQRVRKLWVIREYMRGHPISSKLSARVKKYIEKSLNRKLLAQYAHEISEMLPTGLLVDVYVEVWCPYIKRTSFFKMLCTKHSRVLWWLCHSGVHGVPVLEGDRIFSTWDKASHMHFLWQGAFLYSRTDELSEEVTEEECRKPGLTICEPVLWTTWENLGDLLALSDSTLLSLSAASFEKIMLEYEKALPEANDRACAIIEWLNDPEYVPSDLLPNHLVRM
eukprot:TRINITY_DN19893_c0_g1_i1.p1 TRINITY_DN19893_c0_g1~~TRINITY_DN19893_c0_g1_i1.p1  ORF type:complete len:796 (-),score=106.34 TRINITY_DN19893_c0_g1_i1:307-2628(-)